MNGTPKSARYRHADLTDKERAALIAAADLAIEALDNNQE